MFHILYVDYYRLFNDNDDLSAFFDDINFIHRTIFTNISLDVGKNIIEGSFKILTGAALVSLLTLLKRIFIIRNFEKENTFFHLIRLDYGDTLYDYTYDMSIHYPLKARDNTVQYFSS